MASSTSSSSTSDTVVESASALLAQAIASLNQTASTTTNATLVEDLVKLLERTIQDANSIIAGNGTTSSSAGSQLSSASNGSRQFPFDAPPQRRHSGDSNKNGNGGGGLSAVSVLGTIAAVLCAVGVIIAFLLWYRRLARKLRDQQEQEQQNDQASPSPHAASEFMRVRLDSNPHAKKLDPPDRKTAGKASGKKHRHSSRSSLQHQPKQGVWDDPVVIAMRLPAEDVLEDLMITKGTKSGVEIYRGTYRSSVVAVKSLSQEKKRNLQEIETFFEDAKLFRSLSLAPHARLVSLIGVSWDSLSNVRIVTEFMARGDLRTYLNTLDTENEDEQANLGFDQQKTKTALHVSQALAHLHALTPPVLYRDMTSRSVLLDENLDAKLGFFSPQAQVSPLQDGAAGLPSLWLAPEVMTGGKCDERADVYSFGIVLSELDSNALPFANSTTRATQTKQLPQMAMLNLIALGKLSVEFSPSSLESSPEIVDLALNCLSLDPSARPTAAEALAILDQVLNSL